MYHCVISALCGRAVSHAQRPHAPLCIPNDCANYCRTHRMSGTLVLQPQAIVHAYVFTGAPAMQQKAPFPFSLLFSRNSYQDRGGDRYPRIMRVLFRAATCSLTFLNRVTSTPRRRDRARTVSTFSSYPHSPTPPAQVFFATPLFIHFESCLRQKVGS